MLDIERTKELLSNLSLSDEEAKTIRDRCYTFASIAITQWQNHQFSGFNVAGSLIIG